MGIYDITEKMLNAMERHEKETLFRIVYSAYEKGLVPKNFSKYIMIPIPKKKTYKKLKITEQPV